METVKRFLGRKKRRSLSFDSHSLYIYVQEDVYEPSSTNNRYAVLPSQLESSSIEHARGNGKLARMLRSSSQLFEVISEHDYHATPLLKQKNQNKSSLDLTALSSGPSPSTCVTKVHPRRLVTKTEFPDANRSRRSSVTENSFAHPGAKILDYNALQDLGDSQIIKRHERAYSRLPLDSSSQNLLSHDAARKPISSVKMTFEPPFGSDLDALGSSPYIPNKNGNFLGASQQSSLYSLKAHYACSAHSGEYTPKPASEFFSFLNRSQVELTHNTRTQTGECLNASFVSEVESGLHTPPSSPRDGILGGVSTGKGVKSSAGSHRSLPVNEDNTAYRERAIPQTPDDARLHYLRSYQLDGKGSKSSNGTSPLVRAKSDSILTASPWVNKRSDLSSELSAEGQLIMKESRLKIRNT